ncbi:uncharacterized protein METZ01_LOCUS82716, partial [marine metagenome]
MVCCKTAASTNNLQTVINPSRRKLFQLI